MVSKKRPRADGAVGGKLEERVIKCCLARCLKIPGAAAVLEEYVCNTSRLLHRGSLALRHFLLRRLAAGDVVTSEMLKDQMLYYTFFGLHAGSSTSKNHGSVIQHYRTTAAEFHEQATARLPHDGSILNAAARQFGVNVTTSLGETFQWKYNVRVARVADLVIPNYRSKFSPAVCSHIFRRPPVAHAAEGPLDYRHWAFILKVRGFLGADGDETITPWWGELHPGNALKFRYQLLKYHEEAEEACGRRKKRFEIFPEVMQMRHFITIDAAFLRYLLTRLGQVDSGDATTVDFNARREHYQRKLFRCRESWRLGKTIQTDGVAVCFHVMKAAGEGEPEQPASKCKQRSQKAPARQGDGLPLIPPGAPVAANDPGVCNVAAVVEVVDGVTRFYRLTRKHYYEESHANMIIDARMKWESTLTVEREAVRITKKRTASVAAFEDYLRAKRLHAERLWHQELKRRTSRLALDAYIHKRKTLDGFWKSHLGEQRRVHLAWGDGKFSCSGRGGRSVPKEQTKLAAKRYALRVVDVDEMFTSVKCCDCGERVLPVYRLRADGRRKDVRGLRRCVSNACREIPLKSRDYAAARNIMRIALEAERPMYLRGP